jgi:hypothetical protein
MTVPKGYAKLYVFILIAAIVGWVWVGSHKELAERDQNRMVLRPLIPINPVVLVTQGKRNEYQQIAQGDRLAVEVQGPGRLDILTRGHLDSVSSTPNGRYILRVQLDSQKGRQYSRSNSRSYMTRYESDPRFALGRLRTYRVNVPDGLHRVQLTMPAKQNGRVNVRFLYQTSIVREYLWSRIRPSRAGKKVLIQVGGKDRNYHRLGSKKSVVFDVEGPAQLRLLTRWAGTGDPMTGKADYAILIRQDSKIKIKRNMLVPKDEGVTIAGADAGTVVGRSAFVYTYVPVGKHRYSIFAVGRRGVSRVLARAYAAPVSEPVMASAVPGVSL